MNQPKTLQAAIKYFSDEQVCIDTVARMRWPEGPVCPACGHKEHYYLKTQKRWKCKECNKQFSVKLGSIFEDSPIGLDKWLCALWMIANCKNGVSSYEIHRAIGVTQKSAWFMLHRIRLAMKSGSIEKFGNEGGTVECDETFVGPNPQKMHKSRRIKLEALKTQYGAMRTAKTPVWGVLDRQLRQVRAMVIPEVKRGVLQDKILNNIAAGAQIMTDDYPSYKWAITEQFTHEIVEHANTYVKGNVHTNGIENFWSLLKRGLRGTYVAVEPFHLDRYIDEQVFRFNNRGSKEQPVNDGERFELLLSQVAGKRLTYSDLTGKNSAQAN